LYNTISCLGWGYVLLMAFLHLAGSSLPEFFNSTPESPPAHLFHALFAHTRELAEGLIAEAKGLLSPSNMVMAAILPPQLLAIYTGLSVIYTRMTTTYVVVGRAVAIVQTAAVLEILHVLSGLVRSPLPTAVIQVYSRLFLVWGVVQKYEQVC
jgi:very-long-chain (3R)-3-hydroxyacyl-CoA dehydratase